MKVASVKISATLLIIYLLTACTAIRLENVTQVNKENVFDSITVVEDQKTRDTVLPVIENHLRSKGYSVTTVTSEEEVKPSDYAIKYKAWWSWDLATYMSKAHIKMLHEGAVVGNVSYEGKGGLNTNKWGVAERRIEIMLDTLLNDISVDEANRKIQ
jgi:hypothetical protein